MLPSDLDYGAPRVKAFDPDRAAKAQQDAVDLIGGGTAEDPGLLCLLPANLSQVPFEEGLEKNPQSW
jgi:hypothetical protein